MFVTQCMPKGNKAQMNELMQAMENQLQNLMDTNEVGFYTKSRFGLCFTKENFG